MKKIVLLILLTLIQYNFLQAQNFTGRILYENKFFTPDGKDMTAMMTTMMGKQQDYYINARNYKSVLNGKAIQAQIYQSKTNQYFAIFPNKTAQVMDAKLAQTKVEEIEYSQETLTILGKACNKLILKRSESTTIYYYAKDIRVNPEPFQNHLFGNWIDYLRASKGALPLKIIIKTNQFTWESTAIKIEKMNLSDQDFALPKGIQIQKK